MSADPSTVETARHVHELASELSADCVRAYLGRIHDHGGDLDAFLAGMLAALDPESFLSRAAVLSAPQEPQEEPVEATGDRPEECSKASGREDVIRFCRERLGLREEGEDAHREKFTGVYEDREDDGEVWIFFPKRPQADVRRKVKGAGFWYMGARYGYGWRHKCGKAKRRKKAA